MKKDANNPDAAWNSMFISFLFRMGGQSGKRITAKCQMTPLSNRNYVATGRVDWQQSLCRRISNDAALRKQLEGSR